MVVEGGEMARRARGALPMAGASARPERRDAAENRRQILVAAAGLVATRGVDAVSMDEIARAADVGKGTLYRRYAHKGELCQALLDDNTRRFQEEVLARLLAADAVGGAVLDSLDDFLSRLVTFNDQNADLLSAVRDAACGERRSALYRSAPYDWQRLTVAALLRRAVARGECPTLDIAYLPDAILAPLDIDLYLFQRRERGFARERIVAGLRGLLLDGLRVHPPGPPHRRNAVLGGENRSN